MTPEKFLEELRSQLRSVGCDAGGLYAGLPTLMAGVVASLADYPATPEGRRLAVVEAFRRWL